MLQPDKIFGNIFDDIAITDTRLANFTGDHISRLTAQNNSNEFTALIAQLTTVYNTLQAEVGQVDSSIGVQKGKTLTLNQLVKQFKKTISQKAGVIADALGGTDTAAYTEFFPKGLSEYSGATKTQLPTLISRINTAATAHAAKLGTTLTATLQGFLTSWNTLRTAQEVQKGSVGDNRAQRSDARKAAELALVVSIHTIALKYPGDVSQCTSFYSFNMLFATPGRKEVQTISGMVKEGATAVALNRSFTPGVKIKVTNTSDNASFFIYTSATADGTMNGKGVEVKAGKSANLTAADLGNDADTFLLIKNLNDVNAVNYVVELKG